MTPSVAQIGLIWLRNCLLKLVVARKTEGRIEVTGRRGRKRKQLIIREREDAGN